jgi:hypothetical protein
VLTPKRRHGAGKVEVALVGDTFPSDGGEGFVRRGKMKNAGSMSIEQATPLIEESARRYLENDP